jgi:hypothetical protein
MMSSRMWAGAVLLCAVGCQASGSLPQGEDRSEIDQNLGDTTPEELPVPQVGSYPDLGQQLEPIMASVESTRVMLRQDSGTVAADSAFIRFLGELRDEVAEVVERFNNEEFQADVWPSGAAAQTRWRAEQRPERRATVEEEARADSIVAVLRYHGVWASRAEGDTYFAADERILLERLGPYLTRSMRDFLWMQVIEQTRPTAEDGGLMITLNELTERIRSAEQFIQTYPESPVLEVVESRLGWYLLVYLAGLPNTPSFDWRTGEFDSERRENMEEYVAAHLGNESADLVVRYLDLLTASDFKRNTEIDAFLTDLRTNVRLVQFR